MSAPCVSVPERPYLTITDIVNTGLTSRTTLWREIKAGRLEAIQIGRSVRIPRESFDRWLDAHRIKVEVRSVASRLSDDERLELMSLLAAK
ncbi:MAG: helix-turn-helix domain-containing protein [Atopobiaceae bacterium]|nr:helix-turn-helix domain-containing protein [Atopobiaceae bacterium]MBR1830084.1 helix-turn-helix domain-containing protein [Atopobiaceae bacterium]